MNLLHRQQWTVRYLEGLSLALATSLYERPAHSHQHDAYAVSRWLQETDRAGALAQFFQPQPELAERKTAEIEGWILGVG